jgi:hypothetical protein
MVAVVIGARGANFIMTYCRGTKAVRSSKRMAIHGPFSADPLSMAYLLPADTSSIERLCGEGWVRTRTDSRITTESWEATGSAGVA